MIRSILNKTLAFLLLVSFYSCTDVVEVDLANGGNRLVVEASIQWKKGTLGQNQSIRLSSSTDYFDQNTNTPVTGASVIVTKDNDGAQFVFEDQNNGLYIANNFIPELNQSYSLEIINNGNTYNANETLVSVVPIKEIIQTTENGFSTDDTEITLFLMIL